MNGQGLDSLFVGKDAQPIKRVDRIYQEKPLK